MCRCHSLPVSFICMPSWQWASVCLLSIAFFRLCQVVSVTLSAWPGPSLSHLHLDTHTHTFPSVVSEYLVAPETRPLNLSHRWHERRSLEAEKNKERNTEGGIDKEGLKLRVWMGWKRKDRCVRYRFKKRRRNIAKLMFHLRLQQEAWFRRWCWKACHSFHLAIHTDLLPSLCRRIQVNHTS